MAKREQSTFERLNNKNLNRKERRELHRRIFSDEPQLEILHPNAAGIDCPDLGGVKPSPLGDGFS